RARKIQLSNRRARLLARELSVVNLANDPGTVQLAPPEYLVWLRAIRRLHHAMLCAPCICEAPRRPEDRQCRGHGQRARCQDLLRADQSERQLTRYGRAGPVGTSWGEERDRNVSLLRHAVKYATPQAPPPRLRSGPPGLVRSNVATRAVTRGI